MCRVLKWEPAQMDEPGLITVQGWLHPGCWLDDAGETDRRAVVRWVRVALGVMTVPPDWDLGEGVLDVVPDGSPSGNRAFSLRCFVGPQALAGRRGMR